MRSSRRVTWVLALALSVACSGSTSESPIPAAIRDAVASPDRPEADKALDAGRKPAELLAFFGVAPGMHVGDLFAGGGYTTELLARVVGPQGRVYSQEPVFPPELKQIEQAWQARLAQPALANVIGVHENLDGNFLPAPPESLDVVVMNMNYHDLVIQNVDRARVNATVFGALKKGGVYGIVDHSAKPGASQAESLALHRIDEAFVRAEIEKAGFEFGAGSDLLRNPSDDRTWSSSPRVAGEKRGTSDRFVLKFVKP